MNLNRIVTTQDDELLARSKVTSYYLGAGYRQVAGSGTLVFERGSKAGSLFSFKAVQWHSRVSVEIRTNAERLPAYHSLNLRADYQRRFGPVSLVAYLDILNVYGRENANGYEWDERRGVNIIEGLDEPLPTIGLRFEYSWTPGE